jgi:asparagine synthase (glutamine-hydrolysing)
MVEQMLSPEMTRAMGVFKPAAVSALVRKFRSGGAIGAKDNMALVGILSTAISVDKFIPRFARQQQPCLQSHTNFATLS